MDKKVIFQISSLNNCGMREIKWCYISLQVIDISLAEESEESNEAQSEPYNYKIKVGIPYELMHHWKLMNWLDERDDSGAGKVLVCETDLQKILFHYAKEEYIKPHIKSDTLTDNSEYLIRRENHPEKRPVDVSCIPDPNGFTTIIEVDE